LLVPRERENPKNANALLQRAHGRAASEVATYRSRFGERFRVEIKGSVRLSRRMAGDAIVERVSSSTISIPSRSLVRPTSPMFGCSVGRIISCTPGIASGHCMLRRRSRLGSVGPQPLGPCEPGGARSEAFQIGRCSPRTCYRVQPASPEVRVVWPDRRRKPAAVICSSNACCAAVCRQRLQAAVRLADFAVEGCRIARGRSLE